MCPCLRVSVYEIGFIQRYCVHNWRETFYFTDYIYFAHRDLTVKLQFNATHPLCYCSFLLVWFRWFVSEYFMVAPAGEGSFGCNETRLPWDEIKQIHMQHMFDVQPAQQARQRCAAWIIQRIKRKMSVVPPAAQVRSCFSVLFSLLHLVHIQVHRGGGGSSRPWRGNKPKPLVTDFS